MGKIIAVTNKKGGTAKTTTSSALTFEMLDLGKKVLLIDFDPQGTLTSFFNIDPAMFEENTNLSTHECLENQTHNIANIFKGKEVRPLSVSLHDVDLDNLDFIPSSGSELTQAGESGIVAKELKLRQFLSKHKNDYDAIIVDTSPLFGTLVMNSVLAADEIVVPTETASPGEDGLGAFFAHLEELYGIYGKEIENIHILPVRHNKTRKDDKSALANIQINLKNDVKKYLDIIASANINVCEPIPERSSFSAAYGERTPIRKYVMQKKKTHLDAIEPYRKLAKQIISKHS